MFVGFLLDGSGRGADLEVDRIYQASEIWQPGREGDARSAKKHHAVFLVRLEQSIGDVGAVSYELHLLIIDSQVWTSFWTARKNDSL